ncbi:MAG TPA: DUF2092 domain-containing protein [Pirellulales bacterium]|jgi:thiol-disulfide isomerase/thioredoxin
MRIAGRLVAFAVLLGVMLCADSRAQIVGPRPPGKSAIDPQVVTVINAWGKHVTELPGFGFTVRATTQVKQGQQAQSQEVTTRIVAERPNKLAVSAKSGDDAAQLFSDGKSLVVALTSVGKYFLDDTPDRWNSWARIIANPVPSAIVTEGNAGPITGALLAKDPGATLLRMIESATYGGEAMLGDTKCHLINAVGDVTDWQLWIDAGPKPVIRQFVPDMNKGLARQAAAQGKAPLQNVRVTCVVKYTDWEENPLLAADVFTFHPTAGMVKIPLPVAPEEPPHPLLGKMAPAANLAVLGGGKLDLAALRGKNIVILDFWATWCKPCRMAMPIVERVADEFKKQGVVLYAVNREEEPELVQNFAEQAGLVMKIALDRDGRVSEEYQAQSIPQTVLIGKDGTVQVVHVGVGPEFEEDLREELAALVAGKDLAAQKKAKAAAAKAPTQAGPPVAGPPVPNGAAGGK